MATILSYPHIVKENGEPARLQSQPRTRVALLVMEYLLERKTWCAIILT